MRKILLTGWLTMFLRERRCRPTWVQLRFGTFVLPLAFFLSFGLEEGFCQTSNYEGPVGVTGIFNGNVTTGGSYDPLTHSIHREITDIVVPGAIGKYPLKMTRYYNSRSQYYAYNAIGLSPGWSHEYSWLVWADGHKTVSPHGNVSDNYCGPPIGVSEYWEVDGEIWRLSDGGKVHFTGSQVDYVEDPYGQRTTIEYQNGHRWRVTEPGGRCLIFSYNSADPDGTALLTKVEAYDYYNGHRIDWVSYGYTSKPSGGSGPNKMMLTRVTYSDGTFATYDYTTDNVSPATQKFYPLLQRCDDVRYSGPMRTIWYDYENGGPHGAIIDEKYPGVGIVSAIQQDDDQKSFIETRGDGPTRKFTYTQFTRCNGTECGCNDYNRNNPPQQMLMEYTDFQGRTTWLGYDKGDNNEKWYINSVTDARGSNRGDANYTTTYLRGPAPPLGIGQILRITHPGGDHIDYSYTGANGGPWHLMKVTDERGNQTVHTRDINHRITQTDYKDWIGVLLTRETFVYCDQSDGQCSNNPLGQIKTHKLKNGAYVHYRYDVRGLLVDKWEPTWTSTASESEPKTHYDYYSTEYAYTATDGRLVYPWMDRLKTVTGPPPDWPYTAGPTSETYEYDRTLGANGITDLNGRAVPGRGLITKTTHADAKFQRFAYDAYGNKRWEDNELRNATSYSYDAYNRLLTVTRPLNGITNYTYNPTNGGGSPLSHTTNSPDTVIVRTDNQTNIVTTNDYDPNFRKTSSNTANATTWFHYDNVGNQDYVTDPRGSQSGDTRYTTFTDFDARNRKWRIREPLGRTTQFFYDDKLNVTRILRPDQTTETKSYDGMNRMLTDSVPKEPGVVILTKFQYYPWNVQSAGLLETVTDGEMHNTTFEYDPSGLKTKMTYHDQSYQTWQYDGAHNLKTRTTIAHETQNFAYDNRNRKTGQWWDGFPADGEWRAFDYDDASHLTLATNGLGTYWTGFIADVRRSYDAAGRLTQDQQKIYVNGIPVTKNVNYANHDDAGKLLRMYVDGAAPAYDYTFSYDSTGRFEKIYITNSLQLFQYYYDPASNEKQRNNLFNGVSQIYPRDSLNRIQYLDLQKSGRNFAHEGYGYDAASRLGSVTREDNRQDQFTYYNDGELNVVTYGASPTATPRPSPTPPGPVASPTFNPDGAFYVACANTYTFSVLISSTTSEARIRWTTDGTNWTDVENHQIANFIVAANQTKTLQAYAYLGGDSSSIQHADYSYERECGEQAVLGTPSVYPLDNTENSLMTPNLSTTTYTLDNAGNRRSVNGQIYSPNIINQYTSAAGNSVTNGGEHEISDYYGFHYVYMRDQELIKVTAPGITYDLAYDALGRCVRRTINNSTITYYIYDGDKPILEYNSNNALVGFNLYGKGVDEIVERGAYGTDNQWHWYFLNQDHEGSVTHLTDADGNVIERYRYDVFGAPIFYNGSGTQISASAYTNRFLFTGREYAGAWMYEYRARMYHSGLGRFMSEDPKLFDAGDYNLFRYCHNDPIDNVDPMGTQSEATGLLQSGTHDRLWDMTKWFDSSNTIQGNFAWPGTPYVLPPSKPAELVSIARRQIGVKEIPGARSDPRIIEYLKTTTIDAKAYNDSTAWCSAFVNWVVIHGGLKGTNSATALSWRHWGEDAHGPAFGAIAVINHGHGSGHVGFVQGVTTNGRVILLGGNQRDAVRYSVFGTSHIVAYRVAAGSISYGGLPVMGGLAPAPVYRDTGATGLDFDSTR